MSHLFQTRMPLFKAKDGAGKEITFIQEEGLNYPYKLVEYFMQNDLKQKLHDVRDFDMRDGDILVCAFMKSGKIKIANYCNT